MTDDHENDTTLISALHKVCEPAQRCFEHYDSQERTGVWLERPSPAIGELAEPIIVAMETHPKFRNASSRFFGSKQLLLNSHFQSRNLLKIAVERGPSAAVAWCHKVHSTERADLRYVAEVYGLQVTELLRLSNGVSLMPLEKLPPSANAKAVQSQFHPRPGSWNMPTTSLPIGATFEVQEVLGSLQSDTGPRQKVPPRSDELERTIRAFTLVDGAAPVIGLSWLEFVDADLAMAEFGRMQMIPLYEGPLGFFPLDIGTDAIEWVERYLHLAPEVRPRCDIAIERLNLARRRHSPGNKAIEGAICLEALLGPDNNQEITYKLRLRSALLLSTEFDERCKISNDVKEFYRLRSTTVHGSTSESKTAQKDEACATRGMDICAQALRKIVSLNKKFVPEDWELSGGQPQSP
jgi:hypothetical protein